MENHKFETTLARLILENLAERHGVKPPALEFKKTPKGMIGYYVVGGKRIVLDHKAKADVLVHCFFYYLFEVQGLKFKNDAEEREAVWGFTRANLKKLDKELMK